MATNLTNNKIKDTYAQLLHVGVGDVDNEGVTASLKTVYSGTGTASALKLSSGAISVDNIQIDGNTISPLTGTVTITDVNITSGSVTGITDLAIADGGTGASTAGGARTNLGLGSIATQDANSVAITGGSIQNVTFTGSFSGMTLVQAADMLATESVGYTAGNGGTVTQSGSRTAGVTLNAPSGQITLVSGSISGHGSQEFTLTNSYIAATDVVLVSFGSGLTSAQYDVTVTATSAGSCKIAIHNVNNSATPTDTPVINFAVIKGVTS